MKVEIYSDVACPWCYVGKARFERALAAFPGRGDVEVSYRPYQLNPATPTTARPLYDYYDELFGPGFRDKHHQVTDIAEAEGLPFRMDKALAVNTFTAHRLIWLAERDHGLAVARAVQDALLRAYFTDGADVGAVDTLAGIGAHAGMDREVVAAALAGDEGTAEVRAEIEHARALGIQAVPTFVFDGRYAVTGAQEASAFLQVLEQVASSTQPSSTGAVEKPETSGAACADGSCAV